LSFAEIFGNRKLRVPIRYRVPGLTYDVICMILRLAVSVEHRLMTDRQIVIQTHDYTAYTAPAWRRAIKIPYNHIVIETVLVKVIGVDDKLRTATTFLYVKRIFT